MIEQFIEELSLCLSFDSIQECRERLKEKIAVTTAIWVNNTSQNTDTSKKL
jgi:hypothetical protein